MKSQDVLANLASDKLLVCVEPHLHGLLILALFFLATEQYLIV